jgi:hypothetical protein
VALANMADTADRAGADVAAKKFTANKIESQVVRPIFDLFLAGESPSRIAKALNEAPCPPSAAGKVPDDGPSNPHQWLMAQ